MTTSGFDYTSGIPVYVQLADWLRERIESGRYRPGRRLPSKRELRQMHTISGITVDKATAVLKAEHRVKTVMGLGLIVLSEEERQAAIEAERRGRGGLGGRLLNLTLDPPMTPDPLGGEPPGNGQGAVLG